MNDCTRRHFLKTTAAGAAAVSSLGMLNSCAAETKSAGMPMRTLGKTGLQVSQLTFGGGSQFLKNDDGDWEPLLQRAVDMGINTFDNASSYQWRSPMSSEERFGEILAPVRDKVIISTKFDSRDPDEMMREVEQSLTRMKTDYIDILMIHSIEKNEDLDVLEAGVYAKMLQLKEEGVARFIGFSSMNSAEKSKAVIERFDIDACILAMNPTQYGHFAQVTLPEARAKNVGVFAMIVMLNIVGKEATARELMQYALGQDGCASACIGHFGMEILEENANIVRELNGVDMSRTEQQDLETRLAHLAGPHRLVWAQPGYFDGKMV